MMPAYDEPPERAEIRLMLRYMREEQERAAALRRRIRYGRCIHGRRKGRPLAPATIEDLRQRARRHEREARWFDRRAADLEDELLANR